MDLKGQWLKCRAFARPHAGIWITDTVGGVHEGGMSGSPIIRGDGAVVGVLSTSSGSAETTSHKRGGPQPRLNCALPGGLIRRARFLQIRSPIPELSEPS